jgi:glyoxylase-like metal-dependent hydrolase (beta-lactamase superfamily II)
MQVHRIINSPVDSNCFVLVGDIDNNCIVIDPGTEDCRELLAFLDNRCLQVQYVFLTHEHIDHIIGCKTLKEHYPKAKLICSDLCAQNLNNTRINLSRFAEQFTPRDGFPEPELTYSNRLSLEWQGEQAVFFKAMGHSQGSSHALIGNCLFVGDTFICKYKTTTTLPGSSKKDLVLTFKYLLQNGYGKAAIVFPGHFGSCSPEEMKKEVEPQIENIKRIVDRKKVMNISSRL